MSAFIETPTGEGAYASSPAEPTNVPLRIFPLHGILPGPACTCPQGAQCKSIGKHPIVHWRNYDDENTKGPSGGYGIQTGQFNGILVVDLDVKNGKDGIAAFRELAAGRPIPNTCSVLTPSGGKHLPYRLPPNVYVSTSHDVLGPGIDIQAEGAFIVGPGSPHRNGGIYRIEDESVALADPPDWLLALVAKTPQPPPPVEDGPPLIEPATGAALERGRQRAIRHARDVGPCINRDNAQGWIWSVAQYLGITCRLPVDDAWTIFDEHYNPRCFYEDRVTPYPWARTGNDGFDRAFSRAARSTIAKRSAEAEAAVERLMASGAPEPMTNGVASASSAERPSGARQKIDGAEFVSAVRETLGRAPNLLGSAIAPPEPTPPPGEGAAANGSPPNEPLPPNKTRVPQRTKTEPNTNSPPPSGANGAASDGQAVRRAVYDRLIQQAREQGYKPGWIAHQYRKTHKQWPPRDWTDSTQSRFASDEDWIAAVERKQELPADDEPEETSDGAFRRGDHVELAERMLLRVEGDGPPSVFDDLALHRYEPASGLWRILSDGQQSCIVQTFAGATIRGNTPKPLKIKSSDVSGARTLAAHRREKLGFFADAPRRGIAFANGFVMVDAEGVKTTPHDPENRVRYGYDFAYEAGIAPVRWLKFLHGVFRDDEDREEKMAFVQEFFGAAVLGIATTYQRAVIAIGGGENGKSKLADIIIAAFPKGSYCSVAPQTFGQTFSGEYTRALLAGKLLNVCNELPDSDIVGTEQFKAIVTGEPVHARPIRNAPFSFRPIAAHYFAANRLPGTFDHSHGFWRRWVALGFNRNFQGDAERDADIATKIISTELPAVVPWLLDGGARAIRQGGYTIPSSHAELVKNWRQNADQVALFIEERCAKSRDDRPHESREHDWTPAAMLYSAYQIWSVSSGHRPLASNKFGMRMAELGRPSHRTDRGAFYPVRLRRPGEKMTD
ncbi:MAG: phage/plasmid primase, P4 family [Polyangiaceae bacterium]